MRDMWIVRGFLLIPVSLNAYALVHTLSGDEFFHLLTIAFFLFPAIIAPQIIAAFRAAMEPPEVPHSTFRRKGRWR